MYKVIIILADGNIDFETYGCATEEKARASTEKSLKVLEEVKGINGAIFQIVKKR